jgi:hypothetical protein
MVGIYLMHNHRKTKRIEAVVDSGASCCLFDGFAADALGIDIKSGVPSPLGGVIGGVEKMAYYHKVTLQVYGNAIPMTVGFCPELAVAGIVGRANFFEHFKIAFDPEYNPPGMEIERIYRS